ncbi:MAG: DUF2489 domain-containing protein [Gammaproteobacteria bacterium]|nr:DUF2489 domain-containing protein [Gammaproteobacteria bacterium]
MPDYIVAIMCMVVLLLAAYAARLLFLLANQKKRQREALAVVDSVGETAPASSHKLGSRESIQVIARCLLQKQVSSTEAAIRITALAQGLPEVEQRTSSYAAFADLANATAHIPMLDEWKALDKSKKNSFDLERADIEKAHDTRVMEAAKALVTLQ